VSLSNFILKQVIKQEEFGYRTSDIGYQLSTVGLHLSTIGIQSEPVSSITKQVSRIGKRQEVKYKRIRILAISRQLSEFGWSWPEVCI